ncbi:MAG TPA: response regulator [Thermoanaerobaculia bacterium]|jgi:two-component system response regulator MprA
MRPHVLVVEDDFATRESLRKTLEGEGYRVDVATDGEKAVGCLAQRQYDVVVLDLALPRLSGTDVMEYMASTNPAQLASLVVVTGLEVVEIRKLFPSVPETLSKPVMPKRLIASVRRCLAANGHPDELSGISVA